MSDIKEDKKVVLLAFLLRHQHCFLVVQAIIASSDSKTDAAAPDSKAAVVDTCVEMTGEPQTEHWHWYNASLSELLDAAVTNERGLLSGGQLLKCVLAP